MKYSRKTLAVISIVVALAVFSASAFAAASNMSGYETLKSAVFDTALNPPENITATTESLLIQNGQVLESTTSVSMTDGEKTYSKQVNKDGSVYEGYNDGVTQISINGDEYHEWNVVGFSAGRTVTDSVTPSQIRLIELLSDTLIGDTKNYVVNDGGNISLTLTGSQIPELAQVALAAIAESNEKSISQSHDVYIGSDARIVLATLNAQLDQNGMLSYCGGKLTIESTSGGMPYTLEIESSITLSDVGTTVVTKPDLTGKTKFDNDKFEDSLTYMPDGSVIMENGNSVVYRTVTVGDGLSVTYDTINPHQ